MIDLPVTFLIVAFFLVAGALLAYGARSFGRSAEPPVAAHAVRRVRMGREVLWTGIATLLLFGVFMYAR